jgi:hypothetical protein
MPIAKIELSQHELVSVRGENYWRCLICQWEWLGTPEPAYCPGVPRYTGTNLAPPNLKSEEQLLKVGLIPKGPVRGCIYRPRLRYYEWLYDQSEAVSKLNVTHEL